MKKKILENVRLFREKANLSQEQVAEKLHITQSKYARFERGASKTDLDILIAFCNVLQVSLVELITYPKRFVDFDSFSAAQPDDTVMLSIQIRKDKKDKILQLVFGDSNLEILNQ